ncbi:MAG TPA: glycosyltransferase family 4 protein [Candidatus Moranbacteria bacterium]|nr:glycosyltransferase family 4 protein [Candidatus Moranbacteria bacterium]
MKIIFFNYEFPPLGGGAGNASFYMLREYTKNPDIQVDFVTSSIDEKQHLEKMGSNIAIHRLPIGKNPDNIHYQSQKELLKYTWEAYKFSKKLAKENKYDLTHSFFSVPCGVISLLLKRKFGIPYIISLRGSDVPGYSERFTALYKVITPIIKKIWKEAYFVIANSQGLAELALKSKPEKEIGIIPNGIDTKEFFPAPEKNEADKFTIICVSRVTPRKGIRFLIQAFNILSKRYDYLRLIIVGDGNERASLEDLVQTLGLKEKVLFTGPVLHEKVLEYYQKANIFALPSMNEGMSNTMLEALACGLPLIATNTGGTKELIEEGQNGFIVKMKEANDLAEKIEKFLLDKNLEARMGQASRELAEKLDWSVVANEYFALYQKTVNLPKIKQGE